MPRKAAGRHFAACIHNREYPASLELRKIYTILPDDDALLEGQVRVIDESGEDYLYPKEWFVPIKVPPRLKKFLRQST
jgi:hypothetical protein